MTYDEINAWIRYGGGQELWDELAGEFGLKSIMCGNTGTQAGGWFNKEINSPEDFNGLKMRIPGLGGDVIGKLGGSPVTVPGGQIYENLVSGAIDATEWVGAWNDEILKFYEAAKYYYTAGMHEPGSMIAAGFNAKWWSDLSASDKGIIEAAATAENEMMMSEYNGKSGAAFARPRMIMVLRCDLLMTMSGMLWQKLLMKFLRKQGHIQILQTVFTRALKLE